MITISMIIFNDRLQKYKIIDYCPTLAIKSFECWAYVSYVKELFIFKQFNMFAIDSIFHSCLSS